MRSTISGRPIGCIKTHLKSSTAESDCATPDQHNVQDLVASAFHLFQYGHEGLIYIYDT